MKLAPNQRALLREFEEALKEERRVFEEGFAVRRKLGALLVQLGKLRVPTVALARAATRALGDTSPKLRRRLQAAFRTRLWRERRRAERASQSRSDRDPAS